MGLLSVLRRRTVDDPDFGTLRFYPPQVWEGSIVLQAPGPGVKLIVCGGKDGPNAENRVLLKELQRRYSLLLPQVAPVLFELYGNCRSGLEVGSVPPGFPATESADGVWDWAVLEGVAITGPTSFELIYGFNWHHEHSFAVAVDSWHVQGVSIDG